MSPDRRQLGRGQRPRAPPMVEVNAMACNVRFEMRLPDTEKAALVDYAKGRGSPVSKVVRRGIRMATGQREPLTEVEVLEVIALRKRISAIEARVDAMLSGSAAATMRADLARTRDDAQALLGR